MTQAVSPETVIPELHGTSLMLNGVLYEFERDGDEFWVRRTFGQENRPSDRRRVALSTGSHSMQLFWAETGRTRKLEMIPFLYLIDEARWIPRDMGFLSPHGKRLAGRDWNTGCIQCHTTQPQPRMLDGPNRLDTHVAEFGIACEACHGPGAEHVALNRDPQRRYALHLASGADESIVDPGRLDHRRASEVCGQCHSYWRATPESYFDARTRGFQYRPGDDLSQTKEVALRSTPSPVTAAADAPSEWERLQDDSRWWSDGMVRGSGREFGALLETPCFQRGDLSCLSCHSMHQEGNDPRPLKEWANDQLGEQMESDQACLQCHQQIESDLEAHTHHAAESSGSRCYNCHMPYTTYGLLKAIRSHEIDSPTVAASLETGRPNACNQCHLDQTLGWTAEQLANWYGQPMPALSPEDREVAASVSWLLRGRGGVRALVAWSFGWEPAQRASGTHWMAPYLAQLLEDPYPAVRYIAGRSLQNLPEFSDLGYDFLAPRQRLEQDRQQVTARWEGRVRGQSGARPALLLDADGRLLEDRFHALLSQRDNRTDFVAE